MYKDTHPHSARCVGLFASDISQGKRKGVKRERCIFRKNEGGLYFNRDSNMRIFDLWASRHRDHVSKETCKDLQKETCKDVSKVTCKDIVFCASRPLCSPCSVSFVVSENPSFSRQNRSPPLGHRVSHVCICAYVHMCIYIHIYIHVCVCMCVYIYTHTR